MKDNHIIETRIQDIPSIKDTLDNIHNLSQVKVAWPLLRPIFKLLGIKVDKIDGAFTQMDELKVAAEEFASIPDRFNDLFAYRGWIAYDLLNVDVAKAAIIKAEAGDIAGAEEDLVNYYSPETVQWKLQTFSGILAFQPRMRLARLALDDYREGRFHGCIPVVLSLIDGLVNELHKPKRGFFADEVNLEAWDSISAHSKGLSVLAAIFKKGRYTTTEEIITVPYRNGILHGMDLGYDNNMVAAKTWAALFAVRDWARKAEQGKLAAPPEEPKTTWKDLWQQLQENAEDIARLNKWQPRSIVVGVDIPKNGEPSDFPEESPERRLVEYLNYWQKRNYGYMTRYITRLTSHSQTVGPGLSKSS